MAVNRNPVEPHYSVKEVRALLGGVSRQTVDNYRAAGELAPWVCLPGRVLFPASTINRFLESRRVG